MKRHQITLSFYLDEDELTRISMLPDFRQAVRGNDYSAIDEFNEALDGILNDYTLTIWEQFHSQICNLWPYLDHSPLRHLAKVAK